MGEEKREMHVRLLQYTVFRNRLGTWYRKEIHFFKSMSEMRRGKRVIRDDDGMNRDARQTCCPQMNDSEVVLAMLV
jgi:hypothetical protein